jgi:hypothetical protein
MPQLMHWSLSTHGFFTTNSPLSIALSDFFMNATRHYTADRRNVYNEKFLQLGSRTKCPRLPRHFPVRLSVKLESANLQLPDNSRRSGIHAAVAMSLPRGYLPSSPRPVTLTRNIGYPHPDHGNKKRGGKR